MDNVIHAYTDGACSGNPGPAGVGVYLVYKDKTKKLSEPLGYATNNIAELMAIKVALEAMKKKDIPIIIYTDSEYSLGILTKNWKAKKNIELIQEIKTLLKTFHDVKIEKIKAHIGIRENEIVDFLAKEAVEKCKKQGGDKCLSL